MKIYENDWRDASTASLFAALENGLDTASAVINNPASEQYQIDDALEFADGLWGLAFVTAQSAYIAGTVKLIRKDKKPMLKEHSSLINGTSVTEMELCDATANYFKHSDEWTFVEDESTKETRWLQDKFSKKTIPTLYAAGIDEKDSYACLKAATLLVGDNRQGLDVFLNMIKTWRQNHINTVA